VSGWPCADSWGAAFRWSSGLTVTSKSNTIGDCHTGLVSSAVCLIFYHFFDSNGPYIVAMILDFGVTLV